MNGNAETIFAAIAHATRLRVLLLLLEFDELCVCDLTRAIGTSQPHMSRHLGVLKESGLVSDRRAGQWIHYRVNPALPAWVRELLAATAGGLVHQEPYQSDRSRVGTLLTAVDGARCS